MLHRNLIFEFRVTQLILIKRWSLDLIYGWYSKLSKRLRKG